MKRSLLFALLGFLLTMPLAGVAAQEEPCPPDRVCGIHLLTEAEDERRQDTDSNAPPAGFVLDEPGVYLYSDGAAVSLRQSGLVDRPPNTLLASLPQTTNHQPTLLVWSRNVPPFGVTLSSFSGGVPIEIGTNPSYLSVLTSRAAQIDAGATLWMVDGVRVGASPVLAGALLDGEVGSPVELTLLVGTEQETVSVRRQPQDRQTHELRIDVWDERTFVFTPSEPLGLGVYCLTSAFDWCFEIVTGSETAAASVEAATPVMPEPDTASSLPACASIAGVVSVTYTRVRTLPALRAAVLLEIAQGTGLTALGASVDGGYLYVRLDSGEMGWVSRQTVRLDDPFADLPMLEAGCLR